MHRVETRREVVGWRVTLHATRREVVEWRMTLHATRREVAGWGIRGENRAKVGVLHVVAATM